MESTILLVEPDPASQRVMEVSLKKVGFTVQSAVSLQEALQFARDFRPQMILCDATLPDGTGYDLCRHIRADAELARCGVMIMSENTQPQARIDAITAGADEFMRKPVRIKEIVTRATALLDRQAYDTLAELDSTRNFSGTLEDIGLVDLLQLIETGKKTCIIHLSSDPKQSGGLADTNESGRIYCRDGQVIDAELKRRSGAYAVYRMMLWDNGVFEIEFTPLGRENIIQTESQNLVMEGMRQVDEWTKIKLNLPSLSIRLDVDYTALSNKVEQLPEEVESLIRLFDGHRSTRDVLNEATILDIPALEAISRLYADAILYDKRTRPALPSAEGDSVSLNAWLSSAPAPRRSTNTTRPSTSIPGLPSVLGRAMVPAVDTPSQILRPMTIDTAYPQPIAESHFEDEPILLTDASRKRSSPSQLNRPLSNGPGGIPRPRTLTAPPAIMEMEIAAPPPAPPQTISPASFAPPPQAASPASFVPPPQAASPASFAPPAEALTQEMQTPVYTPPATPIEPPGPMEEAVPPSDEFASPRNIQNPAAAVLNQTVEKTVEKTARKEPAVLDPNAPPSVAHQKEDTAERFFRNYDEDRVAEAAGVTSTGTKLAISVAVAIVLGFLLILLSQKEEQQAQVKPAWPKAGGEGMVIETAPAPETAKPTPAAKAEGTADPSTNPATANAPEATAGVKTEPAPATAPVAEKTAAVPTPVAEKAAPVKAASVAAVAKPAVVAKPKAKPAAKKPVVSKAKAPAKKSLPRKAAKPKNDPEVIDRLEQAESALSGKDFKAAAASFRKVISMNKSNAEAHSGLALTLISQGKAKSSISAARKSLKLSKYRNARAYMALGLSYYEQEKDKQAIKAFGRFLKLAPKHSRASEIENYIEELEEED